MLSIGSNTNGLKDPGCGISQYNRLQNNTIIQHRNNTTTVYIIALQNICYKNIYTRNVNNKIIVKLKQIKNQLSSQEKNSSKE